MKKRVLTYSWQLLKGVIIMGVLLTWALQRTQTGWTIPVRPYTIWIVLSWLLCYPTLRLKYPGLYSRNGEKFTSFKTRALDLHQQDLSNSHKDRRWSSNGVVVNPWAYTTTDTQSTDDVVNPLYIYCEHLWTTFLLILFGPIIAAWLLVIWGFRQVRRQK